MSRITFNDGLIVLNFGTDSSSYTAYFDTSQTHKKKYKGIRGFFQPRGNEKEALEFLKGI